MSCGRNESNYNQTGNYYGWRFENGTLLFCDHAVVCEATFAADADIAGKGVAAAFIITAWITILTAACNATCATSDTIGRFQRWNSERRRPSGQRTQARSRSRLELLERFTDKALFSLCDLQLVTGTAIIVAGFAQWRTITFYHRLLVITYWSLTLNSFWAARAGEYRANKYRRVSSTKSDWELVRLKARHIGIIVTLVLAAVFNAHQVLGDDRDWDPFASGKCYRTHDRSSAKSQWLWISGIGLYAVTLCVQLTERGQDAVSRLTTSLKDSCKWMGTRWIDQTDRISASFSIFLHPSPSKSRLGAVHALLQGLLYLTCWTAAIALTWSFIQFSAIWSAGEGFHAVEVAFFAAYTAWNTWDVVDLRASNRPLLIGSESSWGFGQVLPVFLLVTVGLNFFDAAKETFEK